MKKKLIFVLLVIVTLVFIGCTQPSDVIKIGYIDSLSGNNAQYGEWGGNGLSIGADVINSTGGVNGKKIEVIFEDHAGKAQDAVSAYQKLKLENVQIIIVNWSSPAMALSPMANNDKILLISGSATTPLFSSKADYTFRLAINAKQFAGEEANFIFNTLKEDKVSVLFINNDFGVGMKNAFADSFTKLGGKIDLSEGFEQGSADFKSIIEKLNNDDTNTIFLVGQLKEDGVLVKQMKELGVSKKIITDVYSVEGKDFLDGAGSASDGIIYAAPFFDANFSPNFVEKYHTRFGENPNYFAAQNYDALIVVVSALRTCGNVDTDCLKNELFKIQGYKGASGIISFDENGDVTKPVIFKTIKDRNFVLLGEPND